LWGIGLTPTPNSRACGNVRRRAWRYRECLARDGVVFDDVSTVAPLTLPVHTSLMTGRMPPSHGVRDNRGVLAADAPTLAEALHRAGYHAAAFVSAVVLDKNRGPARGQRPLALLPVGPPV
jgi:arylsulfatase A-like enzyme